MLKHIVLSAALIFPGLAVAQASDPLLELLQQTRDARANERAANEAREKRFRERRDQQANLLRESRAELATQERRSEELLTAFEENDKALAELEESLTLKVGQLGEMFGVVRQVAGDLRGIAQGSYVSSQPGVERDAFLDELGRSKELPSIEKLERLWFEMQREMTETGRVVAFNTNVIGPDGAEQPRDVVRVGAFTAVSDGKFLVWQPDTQTLAELERQPPGRFGGMASDVQDADSGVSRMALDPTRGALLSVLVRAPSLGERIQQGGLVGYVILAIGLVGLLMALERALTLTRTGRQMAEQRNAPAREDNPLGRVLHAYEKDPNADLETIESRLDEAIIKEVPDLEKRLAALKIFAAVAPLLGLLGTVTGMIQTFQAITLFGTGDPKLMAGGISQALITTVLGLVVSIPMVMLHQWLSGRSKGLVQILEEESAGLVAERTGSSKA
ncbi:MAG: MotA/TolQ/ExbB proton channel family protein [Oceanococcaceae bacterium]